MVPRNRTNVLTNKFQGNYKRVLCLCSAGCLRSPTAAMVLARDFNCNTRAVGLDTGYAIVPVEEGLVMWAEEFVVMEQEQVVQLIDFMDKFCVDYGGSKVILEHKRILVLDIQDIYEYGEPRLQTLIKEKYEKLK